MVSRATGDDAATTVISWGSLQPSHWWGCGSAVCLGAALPKARQPPLPRQFPPPRVLRAPDSRHRICRISPKRIPTSKWTRTDSRRSRLLCSRSVHVLVTRSGAMLCSRRLRRCRWRRPGKDNARDNALDRLRVRLLVRVPRQDPCRAKCRPNRGPLATCSVITTDTSGIGDTLWLMFGELPRYHTLFFIMRHTQAV